MACSPELRSLVPAYSAVNLHAQDSATDRAAAIYALPRLHLVHRFVLLLLHAPCLGRGDKVIRLKRVQRTVDLKPQPASKVVKRYRHSSRWLLPLGSTCPHLLILNRSKKSAQIAQQLLRSNQSFCLACHLALSLCTRRACLVGS